MLPTSGPDGAKRIPGILLIADGATAPNVGNYMSIRTTRAAGAEHIVLIEGQKIEFVFFDRRRSHRPST